MKSLIEINNREKDSPVHDCLSDNACISAEDQFLLITSQGYVSLLCLVIMELEVVNSLLDKRLSWDLLRFVSVTHSAGGTDQRLRISCRVNKETCPTLNHSLV